jgi:hypothetical protein
LSLGSFANSLHLAVRHRVHVGAEAGLSNGGHHLEEGVRRRREQVAGSPEVDRVDRKTLRSADRKEQGPDGQGVWRETGVNPRACAIKLFTAVINYVRLATLDL